MQIDMNLFQIHPEFIDRDNRNQRLESQVTAESLLTRCEAFLPNVSGKKILDLGCCIGAMGHWCLTNAASFYVGVEIQQDYAATAAELLVRHHPENKFKVHNTDIISFLENNSETFDIIIFIGVLYTFVNTFDIIKRLTSISNEIIIDSLYPVFDYNNHQVIEIVNQQKINNALDITQGLIGVGCRPTESALITIFNTYGFTKSEKIKPSVVQNDSTHESYNDLILSNNKPAIPSRFAFRFLKNGIAKQFELETILKRNIKTETAPLNVPTFIKAKKWVFDEEVAKRFYQEALNNIPDYVKVVSLISRLLKKHFNDYENIQIRDVGSAIGYTIDRLLENGFINVYGLEKSVDMIKHSKYPERIYYGDRIPISKKWDVIILNWTLHFIPESQEFLQHVYDSLLPGGILFLTDKMDSDDFIKEEYVKFKIDRGISINDIKLKEQQLEGVLITKPLTWYLETLKELGFTNIKIINSRLMFKTLVCNKE